MSSFSGSDTYNASQRQVRVQISLESKGMSRVRLDVPGFSRSTRKIRTEATSVGSSGGSIGKLEFCCTGMSVHTHGR